MSQSDEQFAQVTPEIRICFQTFGDPAAEPLLLVMGLGGPMTWWPAWRERAASAGSVS